MSLAGSTKEHRLTDDGFQAMVRNWALRVESKPLSPHAFRQSLATVAEEGASDQMWMVQGNWNHPDGMVRRYTTGWSPGILQSATARCGRLK